jgi:GPH family glycoside/pentoside/hexuronide:cation symporter
MSSEQRVTSRTAPPPLPTSTRFAYAFGQAAEGIKNESFGIFLLFYYTNVLGLSGILAGQAILIALVFDAVTDPLVGVLSDRTSGRLGRRHPYMLASALPLGLFFYGVFAPPPDLTQTQLFLWMATFVVLCRGAMTLFHVPHLSLGAELSSDYEMRTRIVTERTVWSRLGGAMPGVLGLLWFMRDTPTHPDGRFNPAAYPDYALIAAISMTLVVLASSYWTRSRIPYLPRPSRDQQAQKVLSTLVHGTLQALRIRSFRALFFGNVVSFVAWGVAGTLGLHMATFFWHISTEQLFIWGFAAGISVFVGLAVWARLATLFDKRTVFLAGLAIYVAFTTPPFFLRAFGFWPEVDSALYLPLMILTTGVLANFGIAAAMVTGGSMMADVTDEDELRSGRRREGVFFGATSFAAKASVGVGGLIAGIITDVVGISNLRSADEAGPDVVLQLGLAEGATILILISLAGLVFSRYDLTRERHGEIQRSLAAARSSDL